MGVAQELAARDKALARLEYEVSRLTAENYRLVNAQEQWLRDYHAMKAERDAAVAEYKRLRNASKLYRQAAMCRGDTNLWWKLLTDADAILAAKGVA